MTLVIKPVHAGDCVIPISYALCRTDRPLVDGDVLTHFDSKYTGRMIREAAQEFYGADDVQWGTPINT